MGAGCRKRSRSFDPADTEIRLPGRVFFCFFGFDGLFSRFSLADGAVVCYTCAECFSGRGKTMPAAYAHHRFGDACLMAMPEKERGLCEEHRALFDYGVHGPDVLFYYHPLSRNPVNRYGSDLHHRSGREFFTGAAAAYRETGDDREKLRAYLIGFLAHFALDSSAHAYINGISASSGLSHNLVEAQYEAYLMRGDGLDPVGVDRSAPLLPTVERAAVIARVFPFDAAQVLEAMRGQKRVLGLFHSPLGVKKAVVRNAVSLLKIGGDFGDLFIERESLPECESMNREIDRCRALALERFPGMLAKLTALLADGTLPGERFDYDFEGEK